MVADDAALLTFGADFFAVLLALVAGAFLADVFVAGAFFVAAFLVAAFFVAAFFVAAFFVAAVVAAAFLVVDAAAFVPGLVAEAARDGAAFVVLVLVDFRVTVEVTLLAAAAVLPASFFAAVRAMAADPLFSDVCGHHHTRAARICPHCCCFNQMRDENPRVSARRRLADWDASQGVDGTSSPCTATSDPGTV